MGLILVENKDLDKYREGQNIGRGLEAECFFKDSVVTKIFHHPEKQVLFQELNSKLIAFPKDILIGYDNLVYAYTMSFFEGKKIKNGFPTLLMLKNLKEAYIKLRREIQKFDDVCMYDLTLDNILFDINSNILSIIDTSQFEQKLNSSSLTIKKLDKALLVSLCRGNLDWLNYYMNKSRELFNAYRCYKLGYDIPFLEFLGCVEEEIISKYSKNLETIGDLVPKVKKRP